MNMNINYTSPKIHFGATIEENETYAQMRTMAEEKGKLELFDKAVDYLSRRCHNSKLEMNVCYTDKYPTIVFSRYTKKWDSSINMPSDEFVLRNQVDYISSKPNENPISFALKRFLKLTNNKCNNNMFERIMINVEPGFRKSFLF